MPEDGIRITSNALFNIMDSFRARVEVATTVCNNTPLIHNTLPDSLLHTITQHRGCGNTTATRLTRVYGPFLPALRGESPGSSHVSPGPCSNTRHQHTNSYRGRESYSALSRPTPPPHTLLPYIYHISHLKHLQKLEKRIKFYKTVLSLKYGLWQRTERFIACQNIESTYKQTHTRVAKIAQYRGKHYALT